MNMRYEQVTMVAIRLIFEQDIDPILPITTSKVLRDYDPRLGTSWEYWKKLDTNLVKHCDALLVITMPGWKESIGVQAEIVIARKAKKPVYYVDPFTLHIGRKP